MATFSVFAGYLWDLVMFMVKLGGAVFVDTLWPWLNNPLGWIFWSL